MSSSYFLSNVSSENVELAELEQILDNETITSIFQPIVCLKTGEIIGYESLSRGPKNSILHYPDKLFSTAKAQNKLWELEELCRIKAIEKVDFVSNDKLLFINVDPIVFKDEKFKKSFTKEFLAKNNISPNSIIFEITEKTPIEDFKSFNLILKDYTDQGYRIAIDDIGSGYSGLKLLSEIKPHYVKIDMDLIRDIDKDSFKQALIKAFVDLSQTTDMKIIAEGIETEAELTKLMELGVYAGQGYFLQRPDEAFIDIPRAIKQLIINFNKGFNNSFTTYSNCHIGDIVDKQSPLSPGNTCIEVKQHIDSSSLNGVCIVKDHVPLGLVMKHSLNSILATQYGFAVFSKRSISLVMDKNPLIVDYLVPINEVSKIAMLRRPENIYDYVIVIKNSKYLGIVTVKILLEFTTKIELNYAMHLNPLTGLPGNKIIEKVLNDFCIKTHDSCILYFDLDNFKVYNDTYGFENGDKILKFTATLIENKLKTFFPSNSFLGHIGGDDFVCTIEGSLDSCRNFCKELIFNFDLQVLKFFNEKDKLNGYLEGVDRKGIVSQISLTSISIAGVYGTIENLKDGNELAQFISGIKKEAKKIKHSSFIIHTIN